MISKTSVYCSSLDTLPLKGPPWPSTTSDYLLLTSADSHSPPHRYVGSTPAAFISSSLVFFPLPCFSPHLPGREMLQLFWSKQALITSWEGTVGGAARGARRGPWRGPGDQEIDAAGVWGEERSTSWWGQRVHLVEVCQGRQEEAAGRRRWCGWLLSSWASTRSSHTMDPWEMRKHWEQTWHFHCKCQKI